MQLPLYSGLLLAQALWAVAAPVDSGAPVTNSTGGYDTQTGPRCFSGADFPAQDTWVSIDQLYETWKPTFIQRGDSEEEAQAVLDAIKTKAPTAGVGVEFAFAIMITESQGNVRTQCSDGGESCGLYQVCRGLDNSPSELSTRLTNVASKQVKGSKNACMGQQGPCSTQSIDDMVTCGISGCGAYGANIQACYTQQGQNYGQTARCYNTGSVPDPNDLQNFGKYGTARYVHWVANILMGDNGEQLHTLTAQCGLM